MTPKAALATLRAAFPRGQDLSPSTIDLYLLRLKDIPGALLETAVNRIIYTSKFFPTIAEIRHTAAEVAQLLPISAEEALAIVRKADIREDIYRRDGSFAYTERYWRWPENLSDATTHALVATLGHCGDIVGQDGTNQFGWEQGFKASYQTQATAIEQAALEDLSCSTLPLTQQLPPKAPHKEIPAAPLSKKEARDLFARYFPKQRNI